jgi:hypothetical protein
MVHFRLTRERNALGINRWVARTTNGSHEAKVPPGESRNAAIVALTRKIRKACKSTPVMRLVGS